MKRHFLQSETWEKFQQALGNATIRREGEGWAYLAIVEHAGGLTRLYTPYGPTATSLDALDEALVSLKTEAKKIGASFVRVQPYPLLLEDADAKHRGMRPITYSQPEATRVIDLAPPLEEIIGRMTPSKRNVYHNYQKKGLVYHVSKDPADITRLLPLLHDVAARKSISVHNDAYVKLQADVMMPDRASLHYIELNGDVVTASLVYEGDETNYYAHSGTAAQHYKLQANTALIGEIVAYSKAQGKHWFDLYGVARDDDPNHPWAGVSNFKAELGGEKRLYNHTYDVPLKALSYHGYQLLRSVKKRLKR